MSEFAVIGKNLPKPDAFGKATGAALYIHDVEVKGMLHARIKRSERPHARIVSIDTSKARELPGVKAVITAADFSTVTPFGFHKDHPPLKGDKVRSYADEIAAVAAISEDIAQAACDLIVVEYEDLEPVFTVADAMKEGAPIIHESKGTNHVEDYDFNHGDVDAAFAEADIVLEDEFELTFVNHCCLGPTCMIAEYDLNENLTLWSPTQIPFLLQRDLAECLGIPATKTKIIQPLIGGAFGKGLDMYAFEPVCCMLSMKAGRPVRLLFNREEEFRYTPTRQPVKGRLKTGAKSDGTLLAREMRVLLDIGAYVSWGVLTPVVGMHTNSSLYRVPNVRYHGEAYYSNNPSSGAMRGYGNPQATFMIETHMDMLAERLGIAPDEVRRRNANRPGDETPSGAKYTTCGLPECIDIIARESGINAERERTDGGPIARGIGMASTLNVAGGARIYRSDGCGAIVKVDDFGKVGLVTGATEIGQGTDLILTQIVAEELGVPFEDVRIVPADTDIKPWDVGCHASRTAFIAGNAARMAAGQARDKIVLHAAKMLEARPEEIDIREGNVFVSGQADRSLPIGKVVRAIHFRGGGSIVTTEAFYDPPNEMTDAGHKGNISATYGFGTQAAAVEVDTETGQVTVKKIWAAHDVGRVLSPIGAEGQVEGGISMGMGYALTEQLIVEEGEVKNPTFLDYRIATSLDMPEIETHFVETIDPEGPFGAKGLGEMGSVPTAPAIANAVFDAIGVRIHSLPITPEKILHALKEKNRSES